MSENIGSDLKHCLQSVYNRCLIVYNLLCGVAIHAGAIFFLTLCKDYVII